MILLSESLKDYDGGGRQVASGKMMEDGGASVVKNKKCMYIW